MAMRLMLQAGYMNQFYQIANRRGPWNGLFQEVAKEPIPETPGTVLSMGAVLAANVVTA
jgi:hypothetical protein